MGWAGSQSIEKLSNKDRTKGDSLPQAFYGMEAQTPTQGTGNGAAAQDHSTATWTEVGLSLGLPGSLETF